MALCLHSSSTLLTALTATRATLKILKHKRPAAGSVSWNESQRSAGHWKASDKIDLGGHGWGFGWFWCTDGYLYDQSKNVSQITPTFFFTCIVHIHIYIYVYLWCLSNHHSPKKCVGIYHPNISRYSNMIQPLCNHSIKKQHCFSRNMDIHAELDALLRLPYLMAAQGRKPGHCQGGNLWFRDVLGLFIFWKCICSSFHLHVMDG